MSKILSLSDRQKSIYLKYAGLNLPRYTSYPRISSWKDTSTITTTKEQLDATVRDQKAFSLYFHIPPMAQDKQESYLKGLEREVAHLAHHLDNCVIEQLHIGGGASNFLSSAQWQYLNENILSRFTISEEADWSVELDPRKADGKQLRYMHEIGVNRICLGIQDFDPKVQKAIHREQSFDQVKTLVEMIRSQGIPFINFDLTYGLPFQTEASLRSSLNQVVQLNPDRIAYFQQNIVDEDIPPGEALLVFNLLGINRFLEAGYEFIGVDNFAKPNDPLTAAARKDELQRNFQGMTIDASLPLLGFGPSAISMLDEVLVQNPKSMEDWLNSVENHEFQRKTRILTEDDKLRREVINQVFCHGAINKPYTEAFFDIEFDQYFGEEIRRLKGLGDGLVQLDTYDIRLSNPLGQLLRRVVAAVFDTHLPPDAIQQGLGKD